MAVKKDIAAVVAANLGLTKKDAEAVVNETFKTITDILAEGEKVQITGFCTITPHLRPERKGRNPQTGEEIDIAAKVVPKFKAGKELNDAVAGAPVE